MTPRPRVGATPPASPAIACNAIRVAIAVVLSPWAADLASATEAAHAAGTGTAGALATAEPSPPDRTLPLPDLHVRPNAARTARPRRTSFGFERSADWQQPVAGFSTDRLTQDGVQRLADLERIQATVGNGGALAGYLDSMSIRGLVIDSTHNYRRDGLPIQGGTRLALDAVTRVEVLEGVSGMQAGQSSPGGLVNLVVKRPKGRLRHADIALDQRGGLLTAVDVGDHWHAPGDGDGDDAPTGWRLNLAHERLRPAYDGGQGQRHTLALAVSTALTRNDLLEAEIEHNRHTQAGQAALSMTGLRLPSPHDVSPRLNLNAQAWSQPLRTEGTTGSLRWQHQFDGGWRGTLHHQAQRLWSDNHAAYGAASVGCYMGTARCDRFAADGGLGVFTYDSLREHRRVDVLDARIDGTFQALAAQHHLTLGGMRNVVLRDLGTAVSELAGFTNLFAPQPVAPPRGLPTFGQERLHERSTELYLKHHAEWSSGWHAWMGLRGMQLKREQTLSTTREQGRSDQRLYTPWLAVGHEVAPRTLAHIAWGQGVEVPGLRWSTPTARLLRNGADLPATLSHQWELGVQAETDWGQWGLNAFAMRRPEVSVLPHPTLPYTYDVTEDGSSRYHGLVARLHRNWQSYSLDASWMWLDARREHAALPALNGQPPLNVPAHALRIGQAYRWPMLNGLTARLDVIQDGPRTADTFTREAIPAWWRADASLQVQQVWDGMRITWRLRATNVFNQRAWIEAPPQPMHVYIVPMAPRTVVATASIDF